MLRWRRISTDGDGCGRPVHRENSRHCAWSLPLAAEVNYGYKVKGVEVNSDAAMDLEAYCVTVMTEKYKKEEVFRAKCVLSFFTRTQAYDGAHSTV